MLHNIVFTDNIFIVSRMLSLLAESLQLDFAEELFSKKIESDIVFSAECIKRIYQKLSSQEHLHDYLDSMKCLYSCSNKLLEILRSVSRSDKNIFLKSPEMLMHLKKQHEEIQAEISKKIQRTNVDAEIINIVSEAEMAELLNFSNEQVVQE